MTSSPLVHRHTINGADVPLVHRLMVAIDETMDSLGDVPHGHPMAQFYWERLEALTNELLAERRKK